MTTTAALGKVKPGDAPLRHDAAELLVDDRETDANSDERTDEDLEILLDEDEDADDVDVVASYVRTGRIDRRRGTRNNGFVVDEALRRRREERCAHDRKGSEIEASGADDDDENDGDRDPLDHDDDRDENENDEDEDEDEDDIENDDEDRVRLPGLIGRLIALLAGHHPHDLGGGGAEREAELRRAEEREAADVVASVVRRYREEGVPEDDFVFLSLASSPNRRGGNGPGAGAGAGAGEPTNTSTLRRLVVAALAVSTFFFCVVVQTLPMISDDGGGGSHGLDEIGGRNGIDPLLPQLLELRSLENHTARCSGDDGTKEGDRIVSINGRVRHDCSKGVVYVPPASRLPVLDLPPSHDDLYSIQLKRSGISAIWKFPCRLPKSFEKKRLRCLPSTRSPSTFGNQTDVERSSSSSLASKTDATCSSLTLPTCFRGVHDGVVTEDEIDAALRLGADLVEAGGTHTQIHRNVTSLRSAIPETLTKLETLLRSDHGVGADVAPVAFRVDAVLPLDPDNWHFPQSALRLVKTVNRTALAKWEEYILAANYDTHFNPFFQRPFRNPCVLMSDLEADDDFLFHTSVFLSGKEDFSGGATLYVDDNDKSHSSSRKKIKDGMVVEGTRGRIVISTGGLENRRCRFPTRDGIRSVLQIWWGCVAED